MINLQEVLQKRMAEMKEFAMVTKTDACIRVRDPKLECDLCMTACPFGSISFRETLTIDPNTCISCGLCTAACPSNAITHKRKHDVHILTHFRTRVEDRKDVHLGCTDGVEKPPDYSKGGHVHYPCLSLVQPSHFLNAALAGMEFFWLDRSRCRGCQIARGEELIEKNVNQANRMLRLLGIPATVVYSSNPPEEEKQRAEEELESWQEKVRKVFTKEVSRRSLVAGWLRRTPKPVSDKEKEEEDEFRYGPKYYRGYPEFSGLPVKRQILIDAVRRAKNFESNVKVPRTEIPFGGIRVTDLCDLCNACVETCPGNAIRRVEQKGKSRLTFSMLACFDCAKCEEMCPQGAIQKEDQLDLNRLLEPEPYTLFEHKTKACSNCGRPFISKHRKDVLCPFCS
jgi:ferredoxin